MNKFVIYTAIFGKKDTLKVPEHRVDGCDYLCFTDDKELQSDFYKIIYCKPIFKDPNRNAKIFKILPHLFLKNYEYSLWIDGSVYLKDYNYLTLVENYLQDHSIVFFQHPDRNNVYDEGDACVLYEKELPDIIKRQFDYYRKQGFPDDGGLIAGGVILRKHNDSELKKVAHDWWNLILRFSKRDQLSFNYVAWKRKFSYGMFEGNLYENDYFIVTGTHNWEQQPGVKKQDSISHFQFYRNRLKLQFDYFMYMIRRFLRIN